jgi:hypothetical protein
MRYRYLTAVVTVLALCSSGAPVAQQASVHLNPVIAKLAVGKTVYGLINSGDLSLVNARETARAPVDFVSTHTYGAPPLDFRPMLERYGRGGTPIWWTEWGVTPTHFNEVSDAVFSGAFLLRGMLSAMGRIESLSYWVVSDHFEELGRPPALLLGKPGGWEEGSRPGPLSRGPPSPGPGVPRCRRPSVLVKPWGPGASRRRAR